MTETQDLEAQVREALVQDLSDQVYASMHDPEQQKKSVDIGVEMLLSIFANEGTAEEQAEAKRYFENVLPQAQAQMSDEKLIRQTADTIAQNYWMSLAERRALLRKAVSKDEEFKRYEDAHKEAFKIFAITDRVVNRLVSIAEKEGIDKAVQKETRYAILRDFFSTPDEYRAFAKRLVQAGYNFGQTLQEQAMLGAGDLGVFMDFMGKMTEKLIQKTEESTAPYLEKTIKEIYG